MSRSCARSGAARARLAHHLGAELDAHHLPGRADALGKQRERQAGAAGDVEHALARRELEPVDGAPAQPHRAPRARVVALRVPAVLLEGAARIRFCRHGA